jgi:hypothetical protein
VGAELVEIPPLGNNNEIKKLEKVKRRSVKVEPGAPNFILEK